MVPMSSLTIRPARPDDAETIHSFVVDLARFERAEDLVEATPQDFRERLFGSGASAQAIICERDGTPCGFAVHFTSFSTWQGRPGLYLEDLYVAPQARGLGAGTAMLRHLAGIAVSSGCGRFEWSVLDWNTSAIDLYSSLGAEPQSEWVRYRLSGERLVEFAHAQ